MQNGIAIVTGPTSGIGKEIAAGLAAQGAQVVLACRDLARGEATRTELARRTGSASLSVMQVDTSSRASICSFAAAFKAAHNRLGVLVNNAGISRGDPRSRRTGVA
jgi:NAD(P)-dependent dehydrogenase (short-subunit alcohol dehydrogenase family)